MKLSKNLTYSEAVRSYTALNMNIDNTPESSELLNMFVLANNLFQPIRDHFDVPIYVSSFFRSKELNTHIGGSTASDHIAGCAIDLDADVFGKITNADIFHYVRENLDFHKLIWEFGDDESPDWVHISYYPPVLENARIILKATRDDNGKTSYDTWQPNT